MFEAVGNWLGKARTGVQLQKEKAKAAVTGHVEKLQDAQTSMADAQMEKALKKTTRLLDRMQGSKKVLQATRNSKIREARANHLEKLAEMTEKMNKSDITDSERVTLLQQFEKDSTKRKC